MATMEEKILAMLATIKEIRRKIKKKDVLDFEGLISQKDLMHQLGVSDRTARRRINDLMEKKLLTKIKRGKIVFYRKNPAYRPGRPVYPQ